MESDRIQLALARIDAAASRIEAAAHPSRSPAPDPELSRKHEALKREAWAALAELDDLIEAIDA